MRALKIVAGLILVAGLGMLAWSGNLYFQQNEFLASAKSADGQVVRLLREESNDGEGVTYVYAPVVRFTDRDGVPHEFVNPVASNPPGYFRGEKVQLLYAPSNPADAVIDDFFGRWGLSIVVGAMGLFFTLAGSATLVMGIRKTSMDRWLRDKGSAISVDFYAVNRDISRTVNGRHPFRVVAQGKNPFTGKLEQFVSEEIWVDPTAELEGTKLRVFIDPSQPERHLVDIERFQAAT